jgi:hypothetical protein
MIFYDTETIGFHGLPSLIQYAEDDGPVILFYPWEAPIGDTLDLIEWMMTQVNVAFNQVFDHFQLQKLWTTFYLAACELGEDAIPLDHINEIAVLEEKARFVDMAVKPVSALDLMLYSRKGPHQSLMRRKPIAIRKVPKKISHEVLKTLQERITFDPIYNAQWKIGKKCKVPDCDDIILTFKASASLKALSAHVLGKEEVLQYKEVMPTPPAELGYAPFALALAKPPYWVVKIKGKRNRVAWPMLVKTHHRHWKYNELARKYATDDVINTRDLYRYYQPEHGDDDSVLACQVACVRWRGFALDLPKIKELRSRALEKHPELTGFINSPKKVREYVGETMTEIEKIALPDTKSTTLDDIITEFQGEEPGKRATAVKEKRAALKEIQIFDKLLRAGRFHPSFNIIGTLSGRMAGRDKLNPQGINRGSAIRHSFTLADEPNNTLIDGVIYAEEPKLLSGGDFDAFEVVLTDAVYGDPRLHEELKSGMKIHALFAAKMFPEYDYDYIIKNKEVPFLGTSALYDLGKNGVFSMIYFGDWGTLVRKYKVAEANAQSAYEGFLADHPVLADKRQEIVRRFTALSQDRPGGKFTYKEPDDYIETMFGFARYFTLENYIIKELHALTSKIPPEWKIEGQINIRDRPQSLWGAAMSSLFAAACGLQGRNTRAGGNHIIQSAGATITKRVQRRVWDLQPAGIHPFRVTPMNVHDEVLCPTTIPKEVEARVNETVEEFRPKVPLIKLGWKQDAPSWGALK